MGVNIPQFDSIVSGTGYASVPTPSNDASDLHGAGGDMNNGAPATMAATVTAVSIETKMQEAPLNPIPGIWNGARHPETENWMEGPTYEPEGN